MLQRDLHIYTPPKLNQSLVVVSGLQHFFFRGNDDVKKYVDKNGSLNSCICCIYSRGLSLMYCRLWCMHQRTRGRPGLQSWWEQIVPHGRGGTECSNVRAPLLKFSFTGDITTKESLGEWVSCDLAGKNSRKSNVLLWCHPSNQQKNHTHQRDAATMPQNILTSVFITCVIKHECWKYSGPVMIIGGWISIFYSLVSNTRHMAEKSLACRQSAVLSVQHVKSSGKQSISFKCGLSHPIYSDN